MKFNVGHYDNKGMKTELNSKTPGKQTLNYKEGTVIILFVMNLMKLRKGQVEPNDKRTATVSIQIRKGEVPIHLSPIEEKLRRIYSSNRPLTRPFHALRVTMPNLSFPAQ